MRDIFTHLDPNGDGVLTVAEIMDGLANGGFEMPSEMKTIPSSIDGDKSGKIEYTEFLAATLDKKKL